MKLNDPERQKSEKQKSERQNSNCDQLQVFKILSLMKEGTYCEGGGGERERDSRLNGGNL